MNVRPIRSRTSKSQRQTRRFRPQVLDRLLEDRQLLATFSWVLNGDGAFNNAANWRDQNNQPGVPGANDDATIGVGGINVSVPNGTVVNSLDTNGGTRLNLNGSLTLNNVANDSSLGILIIPAGASFVVNGGTASLFNGGQSNGTWNVGANGHITFTGGTFDMNAGTTFVGAGPYEVLGGVWNRGTDLVAPTNLSLTRGSIAGTEDLQINSNFNWTGGDLEGTGSTNASSSSVVNISGSTSKFLLAGQTLNLNGTTTWSGVGGIGSAPGATINNGGTFTILNDQIYGNFGAGAGGIFNNLAGATLTKSAGVGATLFDFNRLNNAGTVAINAGTLRLNGNGVQTGTFNVASGAKLIFESEIELNAGSQLAGQGLYQVNDGNLSVNVPVSVTNLDLAGGERSGAGALTVNGVLNWTAGNLNEAGTTTVVAGGAANLTGSATKFLLGGHVLNVNGNTTWSGVGAIGSSPGSTINNGGTFSIQNSQTYGNLGAGAGGRFNNLPGATLTKSGSVGTTLFDFNQLNNAGTVTVSTGTLYLNGNGTQTGSFSVASGAQIVLDADITLNAGVQFSGQGVYTLPNDRLIVNVPVTIPNLDLSGGERFGVGGLTVTGVLNWTAGNLNGAGTTTLAPGSTANISGQSTKFLLGGHTLSLNGNATWSGQGGIGGSVGATINNGGVFTIQNDEVFGNFGAGAGSTFNNLAGATLTKSGGVGTTQLDFNALNNSGTVNVNSGTLSLNGGGTNFGTINVGQAGTLQFLNNYTLANGSAIADAGTTRLAGNTLTITGGTAVIANFEQTGGAVGGNGTLRVTSQYNWAGGTLANTAGKAEVPAGATLQLTGNGTRTINGGTLSILGSAIWTGAGDLAFSGNGQLVVEPGGTVSIQSDRNITGNGSIAVRGSLNKAVTSGMTRIEAGIALTVDGGTLSANSGILSFVGGYVQNPGPQGSSRTNLNGGIIATQGNAVIALNGGTLNGPGTIQGNLTNAARINTGANVGSELLVTGNYVQTALGTLAIKIAGPNAGQFDLLSVVGNATLSGSLAPTLLNNFRPDLANAFQIATFAARTGDFLRYNGYRGIFGATSLNLARIRPTAGDFDGDGRADLAVFRNANATTFVLGSASGGISRQFGPAGSSYPAPGDYQGDGKADITAYLNATQQFGIIPSDGGAPFLDKISTAVAGDIPIPADFDGDGRTDLAYFRASSTTFLYRNSSNGVVTTRQFGGFGDQPIPADYDGDGKADLAVFRPSTSTFIVSYSGGGSLIRQFGAANVDYPVQGDFDGDGRADLAIFRPSSSGFIYISSLAGNQVSVAIAGANSSIDLPVTLDYDGDGRTDFALFRRSTATFNVRQSSNDQTVSTQFGAVGDVPVYLPFALRPFGLRTASGAGGGAGSRVASGSSRGASARVAEHSRSANDVVPAALPEVTNPVKISPAARKAQARRDAVLRKLARRAGR